MGCIAQIVDPTPLTIDCDCPSECSPFKEVDDYFMDMKSINCCILHGTVKCTVDSTTTTVAGAIVYAINQADNTKVFAGMTNANGEYYICVPPNHTNCTCETATYEILAFCCDGDCCCDYCPDGSCNCGDCGDCGGC